MKSNKKIDWNIKISSLCAFILVNGCSMKNESMVSTEITELKKLVQISIPAKTVQWEIFDWPGDKGLLPSNPEYVTLVAEVESTDPKWIEANNEPVENMFIVPGSARPWLSASFRAMLTKKQSLDLQKLNCRNYKSKLIATREPIKAFVCESAGRVLFYFRIADYTPKIDPKDSLPPPMPESEPKSTHQ
jgi:hypothetical protein